MAFPTINAITESAITVAGTSGTINFADNAGDRVVIFISFNTDAAQDIDSLSDDFVDLTETTNNFHIVYKDLDGSEGGTLAIGYSLSGKFSAIAINYDAGTFDPGTPPEFSTLTTAAGGSGGQNPNSGELVPSWGADDTGWISAFHQDGEELDDDTWCTAAPTDFEDLTQTSTGTAGGSSTNGQCGAATQFVNASSLNPAAFTCVQDRGWEAYTVGIRPTTAGGGGSTLPLVAVDMRNIDDMGGMRG